MTPGDRGRIASVVAVTVNEDAVASPAGPRHAKTVLSAEHIADRSATQLRELTGTDKHDVAVVLGSGWVPAADLLGAPTAQLSVTDIDGFAPPTVEGHAGTVRSVRAGDKNVLVFLGRTHLYEGHGVDAVVHGVRTAVAAGVRTVVLTNGCGGLDPSYRPGQPVLIRDHINLTGTSPLVGPRFVDVSDLYSPRLRALCRDIDPSLAEGVYVQVRGPQYETPAEIGMIRAIGGDLVGMSTALEAIAARASGAEVVGISLVTNLAAGMTGEPLDHEEVLQAGRAAAEPIGRLLGQLIERL